MGLAYREADKHHRADGPSKLREVGELARSCLSHQPPLWAPSLTLAVSLQALLAQLSSLQGPETLLMMIMDCRLVNLTCPSEMARRLRQVVLTSNDKLIAAVLSVASATVRVVPDVAVKAPLGTVFSGDLALKDLADRTKKWFETPDVGVVPSLSSVLDSYGKWLSDLPKTGKVPIIVIGAPPAAAAPASALLRRCCRRPWQGAALPPSPPLVMQRPAHLRAPR